MTTPDDSLLDVYSTIAYAQRAAFAAMIAQDIYRMQRDDDSRTLAEQTIEDAYCAAGFAYAAKTSDGPFEIQFCRDDAERAKDAALAHIAQALKTALDVDPSIVRVFEEGYQALLSQEAHFKESHEAFIDAIDARDAYISDYGEAGAPSLVPDAQMIETAWSAFREQFPDIFAPPQTFAQLVTRLEIDEEGNLRTPESLADVIAYKQAAARGPQGECRYCGVSFTKAKESVNPGRCLQCDHTLVTEMMAGIFDVFAYDPETGESVYGPLPNADESDDASPSLN